MATVTGLTAARMLLIEAASVVGGFIQNDDLILTQFDGTQINAGNVRGPQGIQGPPGSIEVSPAGGDLAGNFPNPVIGAAKVLSSHLANLAVTAGKIANGAVGTSAIADGAVTAAKLAPGVVAESPVQLIPTMAGVGSHNFWIKQIAPGTVAVSGYLDVDDTNLNRRDTGMKIPSGWEPLTAVIESSPTVGSNNANNYRYFFNPVDAPLPGAIEFEQDGGGAGAGPYEGITCVWFTA